MKPHELFIPTITIDGMLWCALYGNNIQEGISGFGITPFQAVMAFDIAFDTKRGTSSESHYGSVSIKKEESA